MIPPLSQARAERFNEVFREHGLPESSDELESDFLLKLVGAREAVFKRVRRVYGEHVGLALGNTTEPHKALSELVRAIPNVHSEYEAALAEVLLVVADAALELHRRDRVLMKEQ